MELTGRIALLRGQIDKARTGSPLAAPSVRLLGACKGQPISLIEEAIKAGLSDFGENRVQEAESKWPQLKEREKIRLHLIGPLQTNKVKEAVELFDVIQTLDREKLADALSDAIAKTKKRLECYVQVNTGNESQKAGVSPKDADHLIAHCKKLQLPVTGLMCIPPHDQPAAPHFACLREIALRNHLTELSMGMSEDFEVAVRMGATCVRIGRALFGERQ